MLQWAADPSKLRTLRPRLPSDKITLDLCDFLSYSQCNVEITEETGWRAYADLVCRMLDK